MRTIAQFKTFLEAVAPACQSIQARLSPLQQALGHLYRIGDADDPKAGLAAYGKAIRETGPAHHRFTLTLIDSEYQPDHADLCRDLLTGAINDDWARFDDFVKPGTFPDNTRFQVLNSLHDLASSTNRQVEKRLIEVQADTIRHKLAELDIDSFQAAQFCNGRSDVPPYLAELLEFIQDREATQDSEAALSELSTTGTDPSQLTRPPEVIDRNTARVQTPEQYVTLDMAAAMVNRKKRTLEEWIKDPNAPLPDVEGGGGRPHEWKWKTIKPWLENKSQRQLPDHYPSM